MTAANNNSDPPQGGEMDWVTEDLSVFSDPWVIEAMPLELFDAPIDFIFADHHRQRQAALMLHLVADEKYQQHGVSALIEFLKVDFALHVGDEELGFFPILRQQCVPEDNIDELIMRLTEEHKKDEFIGGEVIHILKNLLVGKGMEEAAKCRLRVFAEHIHQHLAVENAVLLPIARVRMDAASLSAFSDILKQRHGATRPYP